MGCSGSIADDGLPIVRSLPCDDASHWTHVTALAAAPAIASLEQLQVCMVTYCSGLDEPLWGLRAALRLHPDCEQSFFASTLPYIVNTALALPELRRHLPGGELPFLRQNQRRQLRLSRELVASLLANMFLCTFDAGHESLPGKQSMPEPSFSSLLLHSATAPQELAKLRMFIHYFERAAESPPSGQLVIDRVVEVCLTDEQWRSSEKPLLPMEMAPERVGFETAPQLAHADFANMFIGGGVLSGGCVQEEIRFAICPELCVSMLVCPCMLPEEAIQIIGGEQFSTYSGYAYNLRHGGDHRDPAARASDGSVHVAILAMDALDFRQGDSSLDAQLEPKNIMRDLNKSLAAFTPVDEESRQRYPFIATGNWGCGAFQGYAPLKALVQWASASQCGRKLHYFPFDEDFGPEFQTLTENAAGKVTVGALLRAINDFRYDKCASKQAIFKVIGEKLGIASAEPDGGCVGAEKKRKLMEIVN